MDKRELIKAIDHFLFQTEPSLKHYSDPIRKSEFLDFVGELRSLLKSLKQTLEK